MKLTPKEITYLSQSFTDTTSISLFSNIKKPPDGTEYQSLQSKGIIKGNTYDAEALQMLTLLAKPDRCSRLLIQNDFCVIEKYTYKCGDKLILADNHDGEFVFSELTDFSDLIIYLSEFTGMSKIKTTSITATLTPDELIVLLAVIDLYRKKALTAYVGGGTEKIALSKQSISDELSNGFVNGLCQSIQKNYNLNVPDSQAFDEALLKLAQKNYLTAGQTYTLTEYHEIFAKNFLLPESMILVEAFQMTEKGEMAAASSLCVTAGVHDIVSFVFDGDSFDISTVSGAQLLKTIEAFMDCPEFYEKQPNPVQQTPPAPQIPNESWQCGCGKVNTGNFCSSCGNRRS